MSLARRLNGLRRTELADRVDVTPAAISQFERGQARPTLPVVAGLALALGVPAEYFTLSRPLQPGSAASPHFRSIRATSQVERGRALAFAELAADLLIDLERYVILPQLLIPDLRVPGEPTPAETEQLAQQTREFFGIEPGPVAHVVRLLESAGVLVLRLPSTSEAVDAFSAHLPSRPVVLLNPAKSDPARSRFDAAHELAHLVMHFDSEPGSGLVEKEADTFAGEFLMPAEQFGSELPRRLDWDALFWLKQRWGVSLKAIVYRGHQLGVYGESAYRRGMHQLSEWGFPEPAPLRLAESPSMLGLARTALLGQGTDLSTFADEVHLALDLVTQLVEAGSDPRPRLGSAEAQHPSADSSPSSPLAQIADVRLPRQLAEQLGTDRDRLP